MGRLILILALFILSVQLLAQVDSITSQEEWEKVRDVYAKDAILLLARMDSLNANIDSLKAVLQYVEQFDYEEELYRSIGTTKEEVNKFRSKFEYTESRIKNREGTPQDARKMYFDEIDASKLRCLPEFRDRYFAMVTALNEMLFSHDIITDLAVDTSAYLVVEGDNLRKISEKKYGTQALWKIIWKANRKKVANADELDEKYKKRIFDPELIYPGQKLFIPSKPEN